MKVEFVEKYAKLSDMKAGDTAVSKDRNEFFVCGYHYDTTRKCNVLVILNVNDLSNQYVDTVNISQAVKILEAGDTFVCKI